MNPPLTLVLMVGVAALSALVLTWVIRSDRVPGRGLLVSWRLVEDGLGLFFMIGMLYAATLQVTVRYALSDYVTITWTEEFARLLLVWAALWGTATLQRSDDHISMSLLFDRLPARGQLVVRLLGDLVALIVLGLVAWHGWRSAYRQLVMSTVSLGLPITVFILPVPLAATLMIVHTIALMAQRIQGKPIQARPQPEL